MSQDGIGLGFLSPQISRLRRTDCCWNELFRDGPKRTMRNYKDPRLFSFFSYFTWKTREKEWEESDSCDFLRENEMSSGDYDSNSGDYDSNSDDDNSNFGGVLIWCSIFIYFGIDWQLWFGVFIYFSDLSN